MSTRDGRGGALLGIALLGLVVPNGLFVYWLLTQFEGWRSVLRDTLALSFILDAFLALVLLAYGFARSPIGPVRWPWFVALSLLGGLGFGIPFYWWLNRRRSGGAPGRLAPEAPGAS